MQPEIKGKVKIGRKKYMCEIRPGNRVVCYDPDGNIVNFASIREFLETPNMSILDKKFEEVIANVRSV